MYIIMYKYSTFRINHKSFRSSMSKNFTVIPGLLPRHPRLRPEISMTCWKQNPALTYGLTPGELIKKSAT